MLKQHLKVVPKTAAASSGTPTNYSSNRERCRATLTSVIKRKFLDALPTRVHIMLDYLRAHGRLPRLKNPQTINEKITWRKLYDHDPRFPPLVDKVKVKEIIASRFGANLIIPTVRTYSSTSELDFSQPPLSEPPYVLKANHGSGLNIFVRSRPQDPERICCKLDRFLKLDFSDIHEEWAYSQVERKILVEPLVDTSKDYRFHIFHGKLFVIAFVFDIYGEFRISYYDGEWNVLDCHKIGYPPCDPATPRPSRLVDMIALAETIGQDFSYVRVDLYQIGEDIKFGEMTFYPDAGLARLDPPEWEYEFGRQWNLVHPWE